MRVFAFFLAIGIAHHAAAQTPGDLARLMSLNGAQVSSSTSPRIAADAGAFGPGSLARLGGPVGSGASANASPRQVSVQSFGAADLARLRGRDVAGWRASPPALDHLASAMAGTPPVH